jgi:hypothetical protein
MQNVDAIQDGEKVVVGQTVILNCCFDFFFGECKTTEEVAVKTIVISSVLGAEKDKLEFVKCRPWTLDSVAVVVFTDGLLSDARLNGLRILSAR